MAGGATGGQVRGCGPCAIDRRSQATGLAVDIGGPRNRDRRRAESRRAVPNWTGHDMTRARAVHSAWHGHGGRCSRRVSACCRCHTTSAGCGRWSGERVGWAKAAEAIRTGAPRVERDAARWRTAQKVTNCLETFATTACCLESWHRIPEVLRPRREFPHHGMCGSTGSLTGAPDVAGCGLGRRRRRGARLGRIRRSIAHPASSGRGRGVPRVVLSAPPSAISLPGAAVC